jgi:hypothetical protein
MGADWRRIDTIKMVVLAWQVVWIILAVLAYPYIRVHIRSILDRKCQDIHMKVGDVTMRKYVTWYAAYCFAHPRTSFDLVIFIT